MLIPASLDFSPEGVPFSSEYDDIYHSVSGGINQTRHVFLNGNELPGRWQGRDFVVLETGFGLGLNFLVTWQAWQEQPGRRLHYIAVEKHPFLLADLKVLHAQFPELAALAAELQAQWPLPLPGLHRLEFGNVILTLAFGDALEVLPQLSLTCDAIYLDGFTPSKNPEMWSDQAFMALARLAAPGATLATWSVLDDMMARLAQAGFQLEKRPGLAPKRYMLAGRKPGSVSSASTFRVRRIAVIGAGAAGAAAAHALRARGHAVVVIEAAAAPAQGASGNHVGVFRPLPSADDSRLARLLRAGFLRGQRLFPQLPGIRHGWTGALQIARDAQHEAIQRTTAATLPAEFCRFVEREEASAIAGWPLELGGWWFPQAGWINPPSLCRGLLAGIECRCDMPVEHVERTANGWQIADIEIDDIVLANGIGAPALAAKLVPDTRLPIRAGRGLVSLVPEGSTPPFGIVATRQGYVTPALEGVRCAGATSQLDDLDPAPRLSDHLENLDRLEKLLPGFGHQLDPTQLNGRVSFRPMSPDRLPIVGPLAASAGVWIIDGFGARGLVFASICAELLASQMSGEPLPLEADLVNGLSPARFNKSARKNFR